MVVMAIVFAGAPIVTAVVGLLQHPPKDGWSAIKPQFYLGILMAALGGAPPGLVVLAAVVHQDGDVVALFQLEADAGLCGIS